MKLLLLTIVLFIPNPTLTPGVVRELSTSVVCTTQWGRDHRHVTEAMKRIVFSRYHIDLATRANYEVDHLIPRELGGADDVDNLWPQLWIGSLNAHMKDRLENRLHILVCRGSLSLGDAQHAIALDWPRAYMTYVTGPPNPMWHPF